MIAFLISAAIIITIVSTLCYYIIKRRKEQLNGRLELPDDEPPMDEVQSEDWNGKDLYIREEDRDIWNKMSRSKKRELMRLQEKKIKSGELVRHTDESGFTGLITRQEAIEKGYIKK